MRIIRACFDEGVESVVGLSEADIFSCPAWTASHAVCIGPAPAANSYLNPQAVVAGALATKCDALHPGYGFLAENPELPKLCAEHGLIFIGPRADTLQLWNDKVAARNFAFSLGIPVSRASSLLGSTAEAIVAAEALQFPLMLKSAGGGGGRGMRSVKSIDELQSVFETAAYEATVSFGNPRLYLEGLVSSAHHVEVQLLADTLGNCVHLGTRDCTSQRRFQKVVEEAPATAIPKAVERQIIEAAITLAQVAGHVGAATVEFLLDTNTGDWLFLEVNGRLQVEHGVTEQVTGIDIVREQIRVASGHPLSIAQQSIQFDGHSVQLRLTCEDVTREFTPGPGRISAWGMPAGQGVRIETHCYPGYEVPRFYDTLLAMLIFTGINREETLMTAKRALLSTTVEGIPSNLDFLDHLISNSAFGAQAHDTAWVETQLLPDYLASAAGGRS
jgi:acetyl-CoA carboxylase biotin carboxylase subunit